MLWSSSSASSSLPIPASSLHTIHCPFPLNLPTHSPTNTTPLCPVNRRRSTCNPSSAILLLSLLLHCTAATLFHVDGRRRLTDRHLAFLALLRLCLTRHE